MDLARQAVDLTTHLDAVDALRAFFIFAACTTLTLSFPDSLRFRFITYGARATPPSGPNAQPSKPATESRSLATRVLDSLASLQVPHSYFTQFYVASVVSSVFWAAQLLSRGSAFQALAARMHPEHLEKSMSVSQVMVCWALMMVQGVRRLHECLVFSKPSSSRMWFVHWLLGTAFYLATGIAIWIEGTGTLLAHTPTLDDVKMALLPTTLRTIVCIPVFILASGVQHDCHHYLFSLEKYTVPTHPLFRSIVCPHYTAECAIYLCLAVLGAPEGETVNKTLASCLCFVAVNLGITASTSRQWYAAKFGEAAVQGKRTMIPWVY